MSLSVFSSASSLSSYFSNSLGSSAASMPFSLTDYAQIKNGSYGKLMKAYYSKVASSTSSSDTDSTDATTDDIVSSLSSSSSSSTSSTSSTSDTTTTASADTTTAAAAQSLASSTSDLMSASYTSDNIDDIYTKASSFVSSYNSAITAGSSSSISSVQNNTTWMTGTTSSNKSLLASVGITIGSDNKLSIDEDTFKNADITTLQDVFGSSDSYSYANQISSRADKIYSLAASAGSSDSTYTSSASYSAASSGSIYDTTA